MELANGRYEVEADDDSVSEVHRNLLLDAAAREGDVYAAEAWLRRLWPSDAPVDAVNVIISTATAVGDTSRADTWLQHLQENLELDERTFTLAAKKAVQAGDVDAAERWLEKAGVLQVRATAQVVLSAVRSEHLDAAERLLARAVRLKQAQETLICTALKEVMRANLTLAREKAAREWLNIARSLCCGEVRVMYLELIKAAAFKGRMEEAERIFNEAQDAGLHDLQGFNIMVDAAAKCGDLVAAERWFELALDAGFEPDIVLFTSLVHAAGRAMDLAAAEYWQKRADAAGLQGKVMLCALVTAAARVGSVEKAVRWARKAQEDFGPDLVVLNCLIDVHAKDANVAAAEAVLSDIPKHGLYPDERSFGPIINAYAEKGKFQEAEKYFRQMQSHGIPPSIIQYNQLLKACARCRPRLAEEAQSIFRELMKEVQSQRSLKTRDIRPTRITLKTLGRCIGTRRLSLICEAGREATVR